MKKSLSGIWTLKYKDRLSADSGEIPASVPGNVILDLIDAGLLPKDIYYNDNLRQAEKYETYDFVYSTEFSCDDSAKPYKLVFEGVDCIAEYYLNGKKLGETANALVEHEFTNLELKAEGNLLEVRLGSAYMYNNEVEFNNWMLGRNWCYNVETAPLRKPAHSFAWDIMPRAISEGIWKNVYLETCEPYRFEQVYFAVRRIIAQPNGGVRAFVHWNFCINSSALIRPRQGYQVKVFGKCDGSSFLIERDISFKAEADSFFIEDAKLWWPYGYGEPNLYDVIVTLERAGEVLARYETKFGVRKVRLIRDANNFGFNVNGTDVYVRGCNWTPLSPFHSEDRKRLPRAVELLKGLNLNMVRCWGGNVYESDEFFDEMDRAGIMVWQDFAFACTFYPQDEAFLNNVADEAKKTIKRLRQHPSLVLWCGDNEIDEMIMAMEVSPSANKISRGILPEAVKLYDMFREYLPSSPYIPPELEGYDDIDELIFGLPEQHRWGTRDYYKCSFYANSCSFVSEWGCAGCSSVETMKKFIPNNQLSDRRSAAWCYHTCREDGNYSGIEAMEKQVLRIFGELPSDPELFAELSQMVHAEAFKFLVESARKRRNNGQNGLLWWNFIEGWPMFEAAVVDFYFGKKRAYDVLARSELPVAMFLSEDDDGAYRLYLANDTSEDCECEFSVYDAESLEICMQGSAYLSANKLKVGDKIPTDGIFYGKPRLLIVRWIYKGKEFFNHFITADAVYDKNDFIRWYKIIDRLACEKE